LALKVTVCLVAAGLASAAAVPVVAKPVAPRSSTKRVVEAPKPAPAQELLAEGFCRYSLQQEGADPQDEVKFAFRSAELALPRQGAATPVLAFREYLPDLPEGAPEIERTLSLQEVARCEQTEEPRLPGQSGATAWFRVGAAPGLAPARESQVLGLPWLWLPAPRAGQSWERTEAIAFPRLKERFRYQVAGMTTVGGRRGWKVERSLAVKPSSFLSLRELKAPARVVRWQETFWVDAAGRELLRAERRIQLTTTDQQPVTLSLAVDWVRKGARPVAAAEVKARAALFAHLTRLERKVAEASGRTTLDGAADLRLLREDLADLREQFASERFSPAFSRVENAIEGGLERFRAQEEQGRQQGQLAPQFVLPDAEGRPTALESFRGRVVLLSFWSAG
jgi:hypothetical protein